MRPTASAPLDPFESAVRRTIRRRSLLERSARVLVALSGGPDSTALLHALVALRRRGELEAVFACHVDHRLRPGSEADGVFCVGLCERLEVPLERVAVEVKRGASVQQEARRARYGALTAAAERVGAQLVATAHTRTDQAETVLLRLLRGAGARGLGAIPARRGRWVRPLIDRCRSEVLAYLTARGATYLEDPSNASPRFLRNRVRHELAPAIEALAPGAEQRLARAADLLRDDDRALEAAARRLLPAGSAEVEVALLRRAPIAVQRRAVRRLWRGATGSRRGLEAVHVEAVLRLLAGRRAGPVALPGGRAAWRTPATLVVGKTGMQRGFPVRRRTGGR